MRRDMLTQTDRHTHGTDERENASFTIFFTQLRGNPHSHMNSVGVVYIKI
jgi:hypothetical protein